MSKPVFTVLCLCLTISIGLGVAYRCFSPKLFFNLKLRAHQQESVASGMRALYRCIDDAALMNPHSFANAVGTGIHTNVLKLPQVIFTNFTYSSNDIAHLFLDQWQRPYVVSIIPRPGPKTNVLWFDVHVWSGGASGLAAGMKDDDVGSKIYSQQRMLRVDVPYDSPKATW